MHVQRSCNAAAQLSAEPSPVLCAPALSRLTHALEEKMPWHCRKSAFLAKHQQQKDNL